MNKKEIKWNVKFQYSVFFIISLDVNFIVGCFRYFI